MTVSRVMNGTATVDPSLRESVNAAIRKLGYTPDPSARSLARLRFERIAVLHDDPRSAALGRLLIGVLDESNRIGAQAMMREIGLRLRPAPRTIFRVATDGVAGVILPPRLADSSCLLDALREANLPAVAVCARTSRPGVMYVCIDERRAAYDMTRHLISLGHRRIGFIRSLPGPTESDDRWRGFVSALSDCGLDATRAQVAQGQGTYQSGVEAARLLLDARPAPTAIFASSDDMAAAAIRVAHHRGFQVPNALTVVGFDDGVTASGLWPELTTIRQPISRMGVAAVRMLIDAIRNGDVVGESEVRKKVIGHRISLRSSASSPAEAP